MNSPELGFYFPAALSALVFISAILLRGAEPAKTVISTSTVNVGTHSVTIQRVVRPRAMPLRRRR